MSLTRKARRSFEKSSSPRRTKAVGIATMGSVLASQASFITPASAASSVVVSSCADTGAGSLRAAITSANSNSDNTQVTFSVPASCTSISLASALPTITNSIDIKGPGANKLSIEYPAGSRGHLFSAYSSGPLAISGLTLTNGAIAYASTDVSKVSSVLIDGIVINQASAWTVFEFEGTPGSTVIVENSTVTGVQTELGDQINYLLFNSGFDLTFRNNTVVNNSFSESMIYSQSSSNLSIVQANTIVKNDAGKSGPNSGNTFDGVALFGNVIANLDPTGNNVCSSVTDQGANLFDTQPAGCTSLPSGVQANGASAVIPNLTDTLADSIKLERGTTPTLALLPGSPALNYYSRGDAGVSGTLPAKDQRGLTRPFGSGYDVGAVEDQPKTQSTIPTKVTSKSSKITFDSGSIVLSKSQKAKIKKAVSSAPKDTKYVITGIAGDLPNSSAKEEKTLAKKRANVIKKYLVKLGVSSKNIKIKTKITRTGVKPVSVLDRYLAS